jgi:hypothetical protein
MSEVMVTPQFQQLDGLLTFAQAQLRGDAYLTGSDTGQLDYDADQVCKSTYPHQAVDPSGPYMLILFGNQQLPLLAIWPKKMEANDVKGSLGFEVDLGIQYLFVSRAKDYSAHHHDQYFATTIWWKLVELLADDISKEHDPNATDPSVLATTYHIENLSLEAGGLMQHRLGGEGEVRLLEATACMWFKRPPYDTGDNSSQVVDLSAIYTDHNEVGPSGASPLMQSQYDVPT